MTDRELGGSSVSRADAQAARTCPSSGELELQGDSRKRQPRLGQIIAMANRGYDVVVDVDAEVGDCMRLSFSFLDADPSTIGRSRSYRPSGGPRVSLIQ